MVDDEDYDTLNQHKWYVNLHANTNYAHRQFRSKTEKDKTGYGKKVLILMHREIMIAAKGRVVDHIDGNGLNNQKSNLRVCTQAQNLYNQRKREKNGCVSHENSVYKGVSRDSHGKKWTVTISANGVVHHLGSYSCEKSAAREYDKLAKLLHGEFACLNFPEK